MTKHSGWVFALALAGLPNAAQAQSNQMQHAPATTQAAATTGNETEVVWLRRRVEQLEAKLATTGAACTPEAKSKMKGKKDGSMTSGSMGDDKMSGGAMGSMPMNDDPMGKMKHHQGKMAKPNMGPQDSPPAADKMGDM